MKNIVRDEKNQNSAEEALPVILHVDDDPSFRASVVRYFRRRPYSLVSAESGDEAIRLAKTMTFDAAILDILMPRMDGIELLHELRSNFPDIPIIFLTGCNENYLMYSSYENGADAFITKPFELSYLESQLKMIIKQKNQCHLWPKHIEKEYEEDEYESFTFKSAQRWLKQEVD